MLLRISTNKEEFKPIDFKPGFNAIVAERATDSTDQHSRNARGKSTLLMLVNYALAGNLNSALRPLAADGWEVSLGLEMFGGQVTATRALARGTKLRIDATGPANEVMRPYLSEGQISVADWKDLLGLALFRLEPAEQEMTSGLSARTLLSYVIRTEPSKDPLKIVAQQSATSSREHVSYLLDLDWTVVHELAGIKTGLEQLKQIRAAASDGLMSTLRPEADLLLERAALKGELDEWEDRISGFRVLEDPNSLVIRADELTASISVLRDEAVVDQRMRQLYRASLDETPNGLSVQTASVEDLISDAGLVLAEGFIRQAEDVRDFHAELLRNRRAYLHSEVERLNARIAEQADELARLDLQRDALLRTLQAGGALEELDAMRSELSGVQSRIAAVDQQIEQAREIASRKEQLKHARSTKRTEAAGELSQSRAKLDRVSERLSLKMKQLYGHEAALTVEVDDMGFKFKLTTARAGSSAVDRMMMFCFDLTMLEEGVTTEHHPDFLIHDSTVFDGVDPRQRASALRFSQQMVEATGGQYICTINSNDVPGEVLDQQWFKDGVVRTILDTEAGGLLGREF
ncbi:MAG: DUF2326 domain-containing protein [Candidatus Nanopelagicales bacterium]|nr:DUF2326 domain-containing protein [Candidatus Nanopelagicales bacterium]